MTKAIFRILLATLALLIFFGKTEVKAQEPTELQPQSPPKEERLEAVVTAIAEEKLIQYNGTDKYQTYQKLVLLVTEGKIKGNTITVENGNIPSVNIPKYKVGDKIVVSSSVDPDGKDFYYITDYVRRTPLYWLFFAFIVATILIGKKRGVASIVGMALSFLIIFSFVLPQILAGRDPVLIAVIASLFIIPITFYMSHGLNKKTTMAAIGTIIALIITGFLASFFLEATKLSGFASEEASFLSAAKQGVVNIKGLILAGIIIGALGILDDITVSQAAIVQQLKAASPKISFTELYSRAMDIGKDHIASVVNTLILVYTGAAMPLLLLFVDNPHPFTEIINYEIIAEEIVRTLVASIGLILAVPITTILAASFIAIDTKKAKI